VIYRSSFELEPVSKQVQLRLQLDGLSVPREVWVPLEKAAAWLGEWGTADTLRGHVTLHPAGEKFEVTDYDSGAGWAEKAQGLQSTLADSKLQELYAELGSDRTWTVTDAGFAKMPNSNEVALRVDLGRSWPWAEDDVDRHVWVPNQEAVKLLTSQNMVIAAFPPT
jgi:hypothetical protein